MGSISSSFLPERKINVKHQLILKPHLFEYICARWTRYLFCSCRMVLCHLSLTSFYLCPVLRSSLCLCPSPDPCRDLYLFLVPALDLASHNVSHVFPLLPQLKDKIARQKDDQTQSNMNIKHEYCIITDIHVDGIATIITVDYIRSYLWLFLLLWLWQQLDHLGIAKQPNLFPHSSNKGVHCGLKNKKKNSWIYGVYLCNSLW